VVGGCLVPTEEAGGPVGIALRPDRPADRDRRRLYAFLAQAQAEVDRRPVQLTDLALGAPQSLAPTAAGPPGRRVEGEADAVGGGETEESLVVVAQRGAAAVVVEKLERRRIRAARSRARRSSSSPGRRRR
jgi:hypothetical protein